VLTTIETNSSGTSPEYATCLNNIAGILKYRGDYDGALEKFNEALTIDAGYFGLNHPKVAIRLNNIAAVLRAKGDYDGALEKLNEALTIFETFLGPNHPNTQTVRANRNQAWFESLTENERWFLQTQYYLAS